MLESEIEYDGGREYTRKNFIFPNFLSTEKEKIKKTIVLPLLFTLSYKR